MPKPDHRSQMARAWLHFHAARRRTWKQGVQALRVDWPVYPRRAEHNTVAEGGNRRWAETARQNAFQSRWPRPTRGPPAKASAEIDVAAVTVEGIPLAELAHGPQTVKGGRLDVDEAWSVPTISRPYMLVLGQRRADGVAGGGGDGDVDHALTATFRYFSGFQYRVSRSASAI